MCRSDGGLAAGERDLNGGGADHDNVVADGRQNVGRLAQ